MLQTKKAYKFNKLCALCVLCGEKSGWAGMKIWISSPSRMVILSSAMLLPYLSGLWIFRLNAAWARQSEAISYFCAL